MNAIQRAEVHTGHDLLNIVRCYWPDADWEEAEYLLWEWTAFPFTMEPAHYHKMLGRLKASEKPCHMCNRPANESIDAYFATCWQCFVMWHNRPSKDN